MNKEDLLKEHTELLSSKYRVFPDMSTEKDRKEFIKRLYLHIDSVKNFICTQGGAQDFNLSIARRDFWWVNEAKAIILYLSKEYDFYDALILIYLDLLINSLHKMIENSEVSCVVYPDIKRNRLLSGYKVYEKQNGKWVGKSYTKLR